MEYYQAKLHPDRQAQCDALLRELSHHGIWNELDDEQLAAFIVEIERFSFLPITDRSSMINAVTQGPFTLGMFAWRFHTIISGDHRRTDTLHLLLHTRPTADAGHVMLRPETLADKINEFFKRIEIDFPGDRLFSRKHYVLADDASSAERLLTLDVRRCLNAIPHVALESRAGSTLLAPLAVAQPELIEPMLHAAQALAATA